MANRFNMPALTLLLLLASAALHATWNLLIKEANDANVFTWWAAVAGVVLFLPLAISGAPWPARVWPYVIASSAAEGLYLLVLPWAYRRWTLSEIYPIARGAAPALIAMGAIAFLGESVTTHGVFGILAICIGIALVTGWSARGAGAAAGGLLVAIIIATYSVIDAAAVRFVAPGPYAVLVLGGGVLVATPVMFARYGFAAMSKTLRNQTGRILIAGTLMLSAYGLVLIAYSHGRVSYAAAIREIGILFTVAIAAARLKEHLDVRRAIGALMIFAGVVIVVVWG